MRKALIIGAGRGGTALLKIFIEAEMVEVVAISDINFQARGLKLAKKYGIPIFENWKDVTQPIDLIIEATGNKAVLEEVTKNYKDKATIIPAPVANVIYNLVEEKETLIKKMEHYVSLKETILNSTHDGMVAIDLDGKLTLFNRAAERMLGYLATSVIGKPISDVIPNSNLKRVLETEQEERNQTHILQKGKSIITTRVPLMQGETLVGALAVFKDITEIVEMAEEVTNLKSVQMMLQAIINSSDDAISVVDETGKGIMVNPAYLRLTGLSPAEVIGKPATADIYEGESMHMHVLKTKKPVRGVRMKVGPNRKDVIVNVAPVIVDGKLKGSVGVIHDMSEIKEVTAQLERAKQIIRTLEAKYSFDDIIGKSEEMQIAIKQAKIGASTPATILLRGESGTGKELFAHAIHNESNRKYNKFIRVNCAAISESLLESELFGYVEGAFTGAKRGGKRGLFEEANKGSIFLDEIGELSINTQAKLLRVLQEKEIVRVGGVKPIPVDVRVIAATNVNLEKGINEKLFREDLYYRINKMPIHIPPLRERKEDLLFLCNHLIQKINQDYGRSVEGISSAALEHLKKYDWPGNVRELENIIARAMIYMQVGEKIIDIQHLPLLNTAKAEKKVIEKSSTNTPSYSLAESVQIYEKEKIIEALHINDGNKTQTAKYLGLSVRNLYYKLEKYHIEINGMQ